MNVGWLFGRRRDSSGRTAVGRISGNRLRFEALEDRRLLAMANGAISQLALDRSDPATSLIVQFRPGASSASSLAAYSAGSNLGAEWALTPGLRQVQLNAGTDIVTALAAYDNDANVLFAEPDYRVALNMIPNDPSFASEQWNLHNEGQTGGIPGADIGAPDAWDVTTGDPSTIVAVIDTGVDYTHPDLAPNMWTNANEIAGNGVDDDRNGYVDDIHGYDFVNHDSDPMDDHFHGTHVAGTIAAEANNGIGISGVAPNVQIMALKFLDSSGSGLISDAISAVNYAVANGASISNNSWGEYVFSVALKTAIQNAANQGHIFVAAAGNDGTNNDERPFYPANYSVNNIVSVAATDDNDHLALFSNYGKQSVDLGAPGVDIYSTLPTSVTSAMDEQGLEPSYGTLSGTSMAAPHVAGVMALVRSLHPEWSSQEVIRQVLLSVDRVSSLSATTATGGRLNAAAAVGIPLIDTIPTDNSPPYIVRHDPQGIITGPVDHVRVAFSKEVDPETFDPSDIVSFSGPDGLIAVLAVNPVEIDSRQFDVAFDPQLSHGVYSLVIGPHISDLLGHELDQNGNGLMGEDSDDDYTANFSIVNGPIFDASNVPAPIPGFFPASQINSYLSIDQDVSVKDLKVHVNISFPSDGSLMLVLVSPSHNSVFLSYFNGENGGDFHDTVFDDRAAMLISDGSAPFFGSYIPDGPLGTFFGESARGTWSLIIQNWSPNAATGTLNSWSLELNPDRPSQNLNQPPIPTDDEFATDAGTPLLLSAADLLVNDHDPENDPLSVVAVQNSVGGATVLNGDGTIRYTPTLGGPAVGSFQYIVSDGINTVLANVTVHIGLLQFRWHNSHNSADVNNDGVVSANDSLLIINRLNSFGAAPIERIAFDFSATLYFDVVPDNIVAPADALEVINYLNAHSSDGQSALLLEGEGDEQAANDDAAIVVTNPPKAAKDAAMLLPPSQPTAPTLNSTSTPASRSTELMHDDRSRYTAAVDHCLRTDRVDSIFDDLRLL